MYKKTKYLKTCGYKLQTFKYTLKYLKKKSVISIVTFLLEGMSLLSQRNERQTNKAPSAIWDKGMF